MNRVWREFYRQDNTDGLLDVIKIKKLAKKTGKGILDCKNAFDLFDKDMDKASKYLENKTE